MISLAPFEFRPIEAGKGREGAEKDRQATGEKTERPVFNLGFENAREGVLIEDLDRQDAGINYFAGNDRSDGKGNDERVIEADNGFHRSSGFLQKGDQAIFNSSSGGCCGLSCLQEACGQEFFRGRRCLCGIHSSWQVFPEGRQQLGTLLVLQDSSRSCDPQKLPGYPVFCAGPFLSQRVFVVCETFFGKVRESEKQAFTVEKALTQEIAGITG